VFDLRLRRFPTTADSRLIPLSRGVAPSAERTYNSVRGVWPAALTTCMGSPHRVPKMLDHCHPRPTIADGKAAGHRGFSSIPNNSRSRGVRSRPTGQLIRFTPPELRVQRSGRVTAALLWTLLERWLPYCGFLRSL